MVTIYVLQVKMVSMVALVATDIMYNNSGVAIRVSGPPCRSLAVPTSVGSVEHYRLYNICLSIYSDCILLRFERYF